VAGALIGHADGWLGGLAPSSSCATGAGGTVMRSGSSLELVLLCRVMNLHFSCHSEGGRLVASFSILKVESSLTCNWGETKPVFRLSTSAMSL